MTQRRTTEAERLATRELDPKMFAPEAKLAWQEYWDHVLIGRWDTVRAFFEALKGRRWT